ncbi:MAG: hypothetical protein LBH46_03740 [Rickettsiales bacterium]|jgi:hypothetical protein|nr:hypothetical protein [Rickettsiales bacterium]
MIVKSIENATKTIDIAIYSQQRKIVKIVKKHFVTTEEKMNIMKDLKI